MAGVVENGGKEGGYASWPAGPVAGTCDNGQKILSLDMDVSFPISGIFLNADEFDTLIGIFIKIAIAIS